MYKQNKGFSYNSCGPATISLVNFLARYVLFVGTGKYLEMCFDHLKILAKLF